MAAHIDYYFTPRSPWAYLGATRFADMVRKYGATVTVMPVDYGKVFPVSGGLPLAKRPPQRQAYRLTELRRWREYLQVPLNLQPRHVPSDDRFVSQLIIAARQQSQDAALALAFALGRALWAEERDINDRATQEQILAACNLDPAVMLVAAGGQAASDAFDADTEKAIALQVFGAPTYVLNDELFWGQDRLDFLERALARQG